MGVLMVWLKRGDQCGSNDMISAGFGAVGAVVWVCKVAGGSTSGRHGCTHSVERVAGHWGTYSPASTCPHGFRVDVGLGACVGAEVALHDHTSTLCSHFLTNCSRLGAVVRAE